ncbi:MFS transporter [Amorphus sp. 3PC139-8]|uniref:MFS transporter n=1 Tax=Amorphus sp. 3PC139-8 TaxID=2735676 RepID=UPI00345DC3F8
MSASSSPAVKAAVPLPVILISGCLVALLSFGERSAFGLFLSPMTEARGWTRETFALALAVQNLVWGAAQPVMGALADRYGTGRVLVLGGVFYAIGLYVASFAADPLMLQLGMGISVGVGLAAGSFTIVIAAFGRSVTPAKQSLAFGLATAAGSFGQFLFGPLTQALIEGVGWERTLVVLAVAITTLVPLAYALRGRAAIDLGAVPQTFREALAEAFGYRSYILLVFGFFVCGFHLAFIAVHLPPYLTDLGMSPMLGGWALALIGLFNIVGSLSAGAIGARFSKSYALSALYLARAAIILAFISFPVSPASVLLFAAGMGLLWLSTVPLTSGLVAVMFGPRYMATLFGFVFFSHQIGSFLGVWLGGRIYDQTGSYDLVWWISIGLGVFAALVHLPIRDAPAPRLAAA